MAKVHLEPINTTTYDREANPDAVIAKVEYYKASGKWYTTEHYVVTSDITDEYALREAVINELNCRTRLLSCTVRIVYVDKEWHENSIPVLLPALI